MNKIIKGALLAMLMIGLCPIQAIDAVSINEEGERGKQEVVVDSNEVDTDLNIVSTKEELKKEIESDNKDPILYEGNKKDLFLMNLKDPEKFKVDIYPGIDTYRNDSKVFITDTSKANEEQLEFYNQNLDLMKEHYITDDEWKEILDNNTKELFQSKMNNIARNNIITHYTGTGTHYSAQWNNGVGMTGLVHIGNLNGRWVFCLEAPQSVSGGSLSNSSSGNIFERLPGNAKRDIGRIIAYSERLYVESGNVEYVIAAQVKIWDALQNSLGYRLSYTNKGGIQPYIDTLNQRLGSHNIVPSFAQESEKPIQAPEINLHWNGREYVGEVYDSNNILTSKYPGICNIATNNGFQLSCYTSGGNANHLRIKTDWGNLDGQAIDITPNNVTNGSMTFDPNPNGTNPLFINGNQDLVSGISDPISIKLRANVVSAGGDVVVYKDDQYNRPIPGVTFGLFSKPINEDKYFVTSGTTDVYGNVLFSKIPGGTYYIKEHSTDNINVHINNTEFIPVNVENAKRIVIGVENPINGGTIEVIKTNQNGEHLKGVTFALYDGFKKELSRVTTDSNGYGKFYANDFAKLHNNGIDGIWNAPRYYVKEISAEDGDIDVPLEKMIYVDITKPNDNKVINNGKVINDQYGTISVERIFSRMGHENVEISFAGIGYIDKNRPNVGVKIKNNNILIEEFILNLNEYKNNEVINKQIPIIEEIDNNIKVELFNVDGAKYKFKNLDNTRYIPNNNKIEVKKENQEIKIETPIGQITKQNNFIYNYYEYIKLNSFKKNKNITDGKLNLLENVDYRNDFNESNEILNKASFQMLQPLKDSTIMFNQVNNMYEIPLLLNENNELEIKDIYIEAENGRIYKAHTDKIDNPTTDQNKLNEGFTDKNDILLGLDKQYLLPVHNTFELQKNKYIYNIQGFDLGINNISFESTQNFNFDKKISSTKDTFGEYKPEITSIKNQQIDGNYEYIDATEEELRNANINLKDNKYSRIYLSTSLSEVGLTKTKFLYPNLQNQQDDYYIDHGEYNGNGLYETNYVGNEYIEVLNK